MKKVLLSISMFAVAGLGLQHEAVAGNKDRSGQAGAIQLLNNPWAASSGVFGLDGAHVLGLQAMKVNIAGLARTGKTEFGVSYNEMLIGTNVRIINGGFAQKLGDIGVLGVNIQTTNAGEIDVVTSDNPTEPISKFKPSIFNASVGFAKTFSDRIHAGVGVTFVSEGVNDAKASAACFDAGIQYVTGARNNFHLGIVLRSVGSTMKFSGDGFNSQIDKDGEYVYTLTNQNRSEKAEMPTNLNIGISYDFYLDEGKLANENDQPKHRLTTMGNFTSNSYLNDYIGLGLEYGFREMFMLRGGYRYEKDIFNAEKRVTYYTGLAVGATIQKKFGEKGATLAFDYSYRPTQRPSNGCHAFSLRVFR